jgi:hypothetical protein
MKIIKEEYQTIVFEDNTATENDVLERSNEILNKKYCPALKEPCIREKCAFFEIGRRVMDKRIFRATCSYCGRRDLVEIIGWPSDKDIEKDWDIYDY